MPIQVNPLTLQALFHRMIDSLESAQNQLYSGKDAVDDALKRHYERERLEYESKFKEILKGTGEPAQILMTTHYKDLFNPVFYSFVPRAGDRLTLNGKTYVVDYVHIDSDAGKNSVYLID